MNLLRTSSRDHGDNLAMVEARTRFLNSGHYEPLADALCKAIPDNTSAVLDAGCGEGYYTQKIRAANPVSSVYGTDVSKNAVKSACRRTKNVFWSVSSVNDLPFFDESFDVLMCVFSPLAKNEYLRVLKNNGTFLTVIPLEEHLWELKSALYDKPYPNKPFDTALDGFEFLDLTKIVYEFEVKGNQAVRDLFGMTPYSFNTSEKDSKKLESIMSLKTKAAFGILRYKKI
ncbi:MAG: methyltransferase domain-containing protein [Clostridia bacterium]|nr:methyltransferase domain-containing protein [Clostridia bacterium]